MVDFISPIYDYVSDYMNLEDTQYCFPMLKCFKWSNLSFFKFECHFLFLMSITQG